MSKSIKRKECGLLFNRHKWEVLGRGKGYCVFKACSKCGDVIKQILSGANVFTYSTTFDKAMNEIKEAKAEDVDSKKKALDYLNKK